MTTDGGAPARRPLLQKFLAILTCSNGVRGKSSPEDQKKRASKDTSKKTSVSGARGKGKSASEAPTSRKSVTTGTDWKQPRTAHSGAASNPFSRQPIQQPAKPINPTNPSARIANYEPPAPQPRRASGSASRNSNASASAGALKRGNSKSAPTSGELTTNGSPSLKKSTSRSLTKLRDHYVGAMMRLGDMTNSVNLGNSVTFESQVFESEVVRKRSQMENEMMEFYLHSSIQPGEWKDARMGSRINRNPSITV